MDVACFLRYIKGMRLSKLSVAAIGFLSLGFLCALAEKIFYNNELSSDNILQESFFIPLTFIFLATSALLFLIIFVRWVIGQIT